MAAHADFPNRPILFLHCKPAASPILSKLPGLRAAAGSCPGPHVDRQPGLEMTTSPSIFSMPFASARSRSVFLWLVIFGALVYYALATVSIVAKHRQHDFKDYYYAAKIAQAGGNPYDPDALDAAAGRQILGCFLYPPLTLHIFKLFTVLPEKTAAAAFLGVKYLVLAALIWLWIRWFNPTGADPKLIIALALLAYGPCTLRDVRAGNIAVFEELGLWSAMAFFLHGAHARFAGLIAATSSFKLTPILFLGLPFQQPGWKPRLLAFGAAGLFVSVILNPWLAPQGMVREFFTAAARQDERGAVNPSSLALIRSVTDSIRTASGQDLANAEWAAYAAFLLVVAGLALALVVRSHWRMDPMKLLMLNIFVYSLCMPRLKDYSYMLLIIPSLYVVRTVIVHPVARAAALFMMCVHFYTYQQLSVIFALYLLLVRHLWAGSALPNPARTAPSAALTMAASG
jgi:hypothetical protein